MASATKTLPVETGGTDITRFNALRHGSHPLAPLENIECNPEALEPGRMQFRLESRPAFHPAGGMGIMPNLSDCCGR
jgi:hypothetical protein